MSKIQIDLSQFKHKSSSKGSTTLMHQDGHEVTFKHDKLHPDAVKQLEALASNAQTSADKQEASSEGRMKLADGGEIPGVDTNINDIATQTAVDAANSPKSGLTRTQQLYNDNVDADFANTMDPAAQQIAGAGVDDAAKIGPNGEPPKHIDHAAAQRAQAKSNAEQAAAKAANNTQVMQNQVENQDAQALGLPGTPGLAQPEMGGPADQPQFQQGEAAQSQGAMPFNDADGKMLGGYDQMIKGHKEEQAYETDMGKAQADVADQHLQAQQAAQQAFGTSFNALNQEHQDFVNDLQNAHIDPEAYWNDHSKIAAGIGMILSGFNPQGRPNAAMEMLKQGMERNIQAQMANLGTKKTLLEANMRQYGNIRDAADMTRVMQNEMAITQMQKAAGKMAGGKAKAAADIAIGQLKQQQGQYMREMALRRSLMALSTNGGGQMSDNAIQQTLSYMDAMGSPQAKEMRARYVPGYTLATREVPDALRSQISSQKTVNDMLNASMQMSQQYGGAKALALMASPEGAKVRAQAQTLQSQLIGAIKQAQHDGVYKESEAEYLLGQVGGSPVGLMANYSSVPKIKELQSLKNAELRETLSPYGMRPNVPQQQAAPMYQAKGFKPRK